MGPRRDWQTPANANWREKDKVQEFVAPVRAESTHSHTTGALFPRSDAITWQSLVQYGMCWCKGNLNTDTNRRKTQEEGISSQGMLSPPSVRWGAWSLSFLAPPEEARPRHLDLQRLPFRTVRQYISVVEPPGFWQFVTAALKFRILKQRSTTDSGCNSSHFCICFKFPK